jgi:hypothetical protein
MLPCSEQKVETGVLEEGVGIMDVADICAHCRKNDNSDSSSIHVLEDAPTACHSGQIDANTFPCFNILLGPCILALNYAPSGKFLRILH